MAPLENRQYTVGWICALPLEMAAARGMLDEPHGKPLEQHPEDKNSYFLGKIGKHNIAITCLSSYGKANAATVATQMVFSFPSIKFNLMVGIGGGIPSRDSDIRLGDVVVSKPKVNFGGVVQYDLVKTVVTGESDRVGYLNKPPLLLLNALVSLEAEYELGNRMISKHIQDMISRNEDAKFKAEFAYQGMENDNLYDAEYNHEESKGSKDTCAACDHTRILLRDKRRDSDPIVHHGTIASGDEVVKNGKRRDEIGAKFGALCVEMEAAGLMDNFPCIVIRGICDYADSHKNKRWQRYAAATAAAHAKELLGEITPQDMDKSPPVAEILESESAVILSLIHF
jgi:nucleoside phosphorylase